jgi:serine/threonine protein kinase/tetratricopeptide (TPR) repeat protein
VKPERWQQVEQLYHSALEKEASERSAYLAAACAGDEGLRREVESLLAHEDSAQNFIESPALDVAAKLLAKEQNSAVPGQTINQYKIISPLGAGGMGEVFLAEDTRLERRVALKFLPDLLTQDQGHMRRFEQEARAVAALSHPNVCMIHEVVETRAGRHCIVMEYVDGVTLRERVTERRMNVGDALDAAIQTASALSAAHAAGIVHRDIKPENIMLRRDGYLKVLDFGVAKLTQRDGSLADENATTKMLVNTSPGILVGTVAYMSPEQARGLPVDARTDIWSLGVVLYETLTGRRPFEGATLTDVIISIAERTPAPISRYEPEAPSELERIVNKCLAKNRDERYQTADDLLVDLKNLQHELAVGAEVDRYKQLTPSSLTAEPTNDSQAGSAQHFPLWSTRNRALLTALAGILIISGLVYALFIRRGSTPLPQGEIKSLAVLPLENLSGDASQEYFVDGMTEALITDLAKISAIRVMSRSSVMQYKGARKPLPDVGRELNVDAVLTGSVVRSGNRVRITVQLVHAATDRNLWGDSYEGDLRDVLALQREAARDIVGEVRLKLRPGQNAQSEPVRPVNPEAYDLYLRGRYFLNRQNKEDNEAAIAALERAVATDATFAAAQAELAQAYVWKQFLFARDESQWTEKAFVAAEKALALDPNLGVAHLARGRILWTPANHFPHENAIREYRRALTLDPTLDEARNQLALVYCHIGAFEESLHEAQEAISLNPNNNLAQFRIGETLNFQGKYEQALTALRAIPHDVNPALVGHQIALALFNLGRKEEASATIEQFLKDYPEDNRGLFTSLEAMLAASAGQERKAEDNIKLAVERGKGFGHFHHSAYNIACAYALMKKPEQAIKWLETAADDGFPCYPLFERDTNLDSLRQDPRFITFLEKQKQQWESYRSNLGGLR